MELTEYLYRIWRRKWIVLGVIVLIVGIDVGVMIVLPRQYHATAVLEVGAARAMLATPGEMNIISQPSGQTASILPDTQDFLNILTSQSFGQEAKSRVKDQLAASNQVSDAGNAADGNSVATPAPANDVSYNYTGTADPVRGTGTDMLSIEVTSSSPIVAKTAADVLSEALLEESAKNSSEAGQQFIDSIQKNQIDPIDKQLQDIRNQTEALKATQGGDVTARNVKIAQLDDQSKNLEDTRKQYTDMIARVQVNAAVANNDLMPFASAVLPTTKAAPPIFRSALVAAIVGLLVSVMLVLFMDFRKGRRPDSTF